MKGMRSFVIMRWTVVVALVFVVLFGAGCSRLTMDNYNKIKAGIAYNEVVHILGSPDKCSDVIGMRSCMWGDETKSITVAFVGDKVILFSAQNVR